MATLRNLGRDTEAGLKDKIENDTAYEFKDFETGEKPENITVKNDLTQYNSRIKKTGETDFEWDSLVLEIDKMENVDIDKYVNVVCDSFANPDFVWHKDPGKGRPIQTYQVDGKRQVLFDLHEDEHGYHLHLKVYRYTVNKETRNVASAPNDVAKVADAQLEFLNKNLTANGFLEIGKSVKSFGNQPDRPTEETKIDAIEIIHDKKTVDEVLENISNSAEYSEASISTALDADQKELALLLQKVKQVTAEIETKKEAKRLIGENKQLAYSLKHSDEQLKNANEHIGKLEFGIEKLKEIHEEELQEKDQNYRAIISEKDNSIKENQEKIGSLNEEVENYIEELSGANAKIELQDLTISEVNQNLNEANKSLKEQMELANSYKELVTMQKEQIEESKKSLKEQQEAFKQLQEESKKVISEQQEAFKKLQEESKNQIEALQEANKKQAEEIAKANDELKKKSEVIDKLNRDNKSLKETNNKLSNIIEQFSQVTAKMKSSYDEFVKSVKDKLKSSPAIKKNLSEIMGGVEKEQENIYKEVSKVANQVDGQNLKIDKSLIEANKPIEPKENPNDKKNGLDLK